MSHSPSERVEPAATGECSGSRAARGSGRRRRKASSLGDEFTHKSLQAEFEARQAQHAAQQAAEQTQPALPPLLFNESRIGDHVVRTPSTFQMLQAGYSPDVIEQLTAAWEAEQNGETPDSGVEVLDQAEQLETGENGVSEEQIEPSEAAEEPESGSDAQNGPRAGEIGREMGAADLIENSEILVDEQTGSRSDSATSRTPDVGPILATSGRDMATIGRTLGTASDHEAELELLELRYRIVTEGASWTDDEAFRTRVRIELLKEDLGIPDDAPEPSTDAVIAEYERRVLGPTQPDQQQGAEPSSPPGSSGPSPLAPTSVDVEQIDETVPSSPPGSSGPSPAPPGLVDAGSLSTPASVNPTAPYRSGVWELVDTAKNAKVEASLEAIARFDEDARGRLAAGERIGNNDVAKGIGAKWLGEYGDKLDPVVRHEMLLRAERMAERSAEFEVGKALKEKLDALAKRGDFVTDEYRDIEQRLDASNAQRRLIEQRMVEGIYEEDSKWRPGQPVPSRQYSKAMTARLHQIAEQALADQAALEAQRDEQLGG